MAAPVVLPEQQHQRQSWTSERLSWDATLPGNTWSRRLNAMANYDDSWEVHAFAQDASSSEYWPPRSYPCTVCKRQFRSAQSLGGHMNVHTREQLHAHLRNSATTDDAVAPAVPVVSSVNSTSAAPFSQRPAAAPKRGDRRRNKIEANHPWDQTCKTHLRRLRKPSRTAELFSPQPLSLRLLGSTGGINSSAVPLPESFLATQSLLGIPVDDILLQLPRWRKSSWSRLGRVFHPYKRSRCKADGHVNLRRFLVQAEDTREDTPIVDLELRLGQSSSCT